MPVQRDEALLLRRTAFGESSLVVHALTREHGRVHLLAKGAYRRTSGYYLVLDLFDELALEWSTPRSSDLATLRRGEVLRRRRAACSDPARFRAGVEILELCELAAQPGESGARLFEPATEALDALEEGTHAPRAVVVVFELRFLQNLGLAPALRGCASCGEEAPALGGADPDAARVAFSAGAGGRLCLACAREAKESGRRVGTLPLSLVEDAARLRESGLAAADALGPDRLAEARRFTERFMDYHLETRPKSRRGAAERSAR